MTSSPNHDIAQTPSAKQITEDLVQLVEEVANVRIDHQVGLLSSGLTSADLVTLIARAAARWRVDIPVDVLFHAGSLTSLAYHVHSALAPALIPPAQRENNSSDRRRVISAEERRALRNQIYAAVRTSS